MNLFTKKKIIIGIIILVVAVSIIVFLVFSKTSTDKTDKADVFNQKMITFYDQYVSLQQERLRLAKLGYEVASDEKILDQMSIARSKAREVLNTLQEMGDIARGFESQEISGLVSAAWAKEKLSYRQKYGLVGAILSKIPVVGKLVDGFDIVHESARMGIYKAYHNACDADREILDGELKGCGLSGIDDIFTCNFVKVDKIIREAHTFEFGVGDEIKQEVNLAKAAAKLGRAATLAYVDGILAVTGAKDVSPDYLPGDLEDFLKIMLGKQTVKDYLKSKAVDTGMEVWRKAVETEEKTEREDEEEVIVATDNEVEETITGVLTGQIPSDILKPEDEKTGIAADQVQPYDKWTEEEKRAVAEKLNELEQEKLLIAMVKIKGQDKTKLIVPEGEWEVLDAAEKTVPVVNKNVRINKNELTSIVNMIIRINKLWDNFEETLKILDKCKIYEPSEEVKWEEILAGLETDEEAIKLVGNVTVNSSVFVSQEVDSRSHKRKGSGTISLAIIGTQVFGSCNISARDYWKCPEGEKYGDYCISVTGGKYPAGSWVPGTPVDVPGGTVVGTYYPSSGRIEASLGKHSFTGTLSGEKASGKFYYQLPDGQPAFFWSAEVVE